MGYIQVIFEGLDKYRIINESDSVISFGADFSLEKYENNEWINILDENQPCVLIMYHLESNSSEVYPLGVKLEKGLYRLGKWVGVLDEDVIQCLKCDIIVK